MDNKKDWFVTVLTDTGLSTYLWLYGMNLYAPITFLETGWPTFFCDKIILEINDGETILFKMCESCFAILTKDMSWNCRDCTPKPTNI